MKRKNSKKILLHKIEIAKLNLTEKIQVKGGSSLICATSGIDEITNTSTQCQFSDFCQVDQ